MSNKQDPRLVSRQLFLLEQTKAILNMLEKDTNKIDWELIAKTGKEITTTAQTALSLDASTKYKK